MRRLFFALWPDQTTRMRLERLNQQMINEHLRKVPAFNLHATLVFLGNVSEALVTRFSERASGVRVEPFTVVFDQLSYWHRPRILCLTCQRQPQAMYSLVNQLIHIVEVEGVTIDKRPYRAHVTLARKARHGIQLDFEPVSWTASEFALVESLSTDTGVVYQVLARWPLRGD